MKKKSIIRLNRLLDEKEGETGAGNLLAHCGGLKLPNTLSSYIDANAMNRKYQTINIIPRRLSNFQPFKCTDIRRNTTVDSSDIVEYVNPVAFEIEFCIFIDMLLAY